MSYYWLQSQTFILRQLASPTFRAHNATFPSAKGPDESFCVDAILGESKGEGVVGVKVYLPDGHPRLRQSPADGGDGEEESGDEERKKGRTSFDSLGHVDDELGSGAGTGSGARTGNKRRKLYKAVINFHGGGYVLGQATDDSRWCRACTRQLDLSAAETPAVHTDSSEREEEGGSTSRSGLGESGSGSGSGSAVDPTEAKTTNTNPLLNGLSEDDNEAIQGAVVFSIDYRLAPSYPFPTAIEDSLSAFIAIVNEATGRSSGSGEGAGADADAGTDGVSANSDFNSSSTSRPVSDADAEEDAKSNPYSIDPHSIHISGFSAGSNLALSLYAILHSSANPNTNTSSTPLSFNYTPHLPPHSSYTLSSLILFYPILDWSIPRSEKLARSIRPDKALPTSLTNLFVEAYLPTRNKPDGGGVDLKDIRLSPGYMSDQAIKDLPRVWMMLCEWDMLYQEALDFAERVKKVQGSVSVSESESVPLSGKTSGEENVDEGEEDHGKQKKKNKESGHGRGKGIEVRVVKEAKHGWDKPPPIRPEKSVSVEYKLARDSIWM